MKNNIKGSVLILIISCIFMQCSFTQNAFKYDSKYYDGYILINSNPSSKGVKADQKIECKIKNECYNYYPDDGQSENGSGGFWINYMTPDGKKDKIWWADVAEIKIDSFYYKLFTGFKTKVGNGYSLINRLVLEGNINYWYSKNKSFLVKDSTNYLIPYTDIDFVPSMKNPKKKLEERKEKLKEFFVELVSDDTELVTKINSDDYIDFTYTDNFIHNITMLIISEYNEWYKTNHP